MKTRIKTIISGLVFAILVSSAQGTTSTVLLYDNFNDGERSTQQLPDSAKWLKRLAGGVSVNTTIGDYRMETANSSSQQLWAHFAPKGEPITLAVGESLSVTMRLSLPTASDASWNRALMWGLFNSNGTRDTVDNTGTGAQRSDDTGYYVETNPGKTVVSYAKIQKMTTGTTADHFIYYSTLGTGSSYLMSAGVGYDVQFSVERISETTLGFSGRVGPSYTITGVTDAPSDSKYFSFDTVSLLVDGRAFPGDTGALTIDRVNVTYNSIPEPATISILALASMLVFGRKVK